MHFRATDKAIRPRGSVALGLSLTVISAIVLVGCSNAASSGASSAASIGASSAASNDEGATVTVTLTEWAVVLDKTSVPAGNVLFNVTNAGTQFKHEFVVIKTDLAPDALPADSTGRVDEEEGAGMTFIGELEELEIGASGNVSLALTAGKYVLICNIVESGSGHESHYNQGMRVAFTVS
jgi:uncharacterized cupredoxin-like copper-binding protein